MFEDQNEKRKFFESVDVPNVDFIEALRNPDSVMDKVRAGRLVGYTETSETLQSEIARLKEELLCRELRRERDRLRDQLAGRKY